MKPIGVGREDGGWGAGDTVPSQNLWVLDMLPPPLFKDEFPLYVFSVKFIKLYHKISNFLNKITSKMLKM